MLTLDDVLDPNATFEPDALRAARDLAREKPWQGSNAERLAKMRRCLEKLVEAYGLKPITLTHNGHAFGFSGRSRIGKDGQSINLSGRLSVTTMLHLFAKCRQCQTGGPEAVSHYKAIRWSINLFKRKFPISFERCRFINGTLANVGDGTARREAEAMREAATAEPQPDNN